MARLPGKTLTLRGWGFIAAGVLALIFAESLGRRDLLHLGIFLVVLPLLSVAIVRLMRPRLNVERRFAPPTVFTGVTARVHLRITAKGTGPGTSLLTEGLPTTFGQAPSYAYSGGTARNPQSSSYEYRIRSASRGMFPVGPLSAEFTDPFGLGRARHTVGTVDHLIVAPSPLDLPVSTLSGTRGLEGNATTRRQANPSNDDVMTREYRSGDPMRRVHWAATARHGELMVRQEESVSTPQATIILDRRESSHTNGYPLPMSMNAGSVRSSESFEWCVTTAVSVVHQFIEQGHTVRFLDQHASPALRSSASAHNKDQEEFTGPAGFHDVAEGLAALELVSPSGSTTSRSSTTSRRRSQRGSAIQASGSAAYGELFMDKLAGQSMRGPLMALLGGISIEEAQRMALSASYGSHSFAMLVTDRPRSAHEVLNILRRSGWHAIAISPQTSIAAAWAFFDDSVSSGASRTTAPAASI
nr:DUF58 domain-containing protein [Arthrobacter roseus]